MMIPYWTESCPYCQQTFGGALGLEGYVRLGIESIICPNRKCGRLLRTKCIEWNHMSRRQRLGYLLSGNVVMVLIGVAVWWMILDSTSGPQDDWQDKAAAIRTTAAALVILAIAKFVRILRSRHRCPEGERELTVAYEKWPILAMSLLCALSILGLVSIYFDRLGPVAFGALVAGICGMAICWRLRWRAVSRPSITIEGAPAAPPPDNPWADSPRK